MTSPSLLVSLRSLGLDGDGDTFGSRGWGAFTSDPPQATANDTIMPMSAGTDQPIINHDTAAGLAPNQPLSISFSIVCCAPHLGPSAVCAPRMPHTRCMTPISYDMSRSAANPLTACGGFGTSYNRERINGSCDDHHQRPRRGRGGFNTSERRDVCMLGRAFVDDSRAPRGQPSAVREGCVLRDDRVVHERDLRSTPSMSRLNRVILT
jgi:hypothetical protein